eukprot:Skav207529  [mRNA]  locus=scaffold756:5707:7529:- [translate_table: standard]
MGCASQDILALPVVSEPPEDPVEPPEPSAAPEAPEINLDRCICRPRVRSEACQLMQVGRSPGEGDQIILDVPLDREDDFHGPAMQLVSSTFVRGRF